MYILLILDQYKYLICPLRVTERVKCGHSILRCKKYTIVKKSDLYNSYTFFIYVNIYCIIYIGYHKVMIVKVRKKCIVIAIVTSWIHVYRGGKIIFNRNIQIYIEIPSNASGMEKAIHTHNSYIIVT